MKINDTETTSLQDETVPGSMSTNGSLPMSHSADSQKSEKTCKAFKDISQYFSKKEWEKLEYSEKITYVYMKRNYTTMTKLGFKTVVPAFMCSGRNAEKSQEDDPDAGQGVSTAGRDAPVPESSGMHQRKHLKVTKKPAKRRNNSRGMPRTSYSGQAKKKRNLEHLSTSGEHDVVSEPRKKEINVWSHRLRERKYVVAYEEISDPEEED
ncbi:protein SSX1 [Oryctolagus cuniculus]|uniref:protein SSX1 n=1 Tax=Oryctolagus cuniculus TaxID=9986 RepID=UPI0003904CC0|nr:protein SSX1 [Oryctolagus cuniculus]